MEKEVKLVNKVKRLMRRIGLPRWLHRYGPKKYEFLHHAVAYMIKQECKLGYRRVTTLLRWLGFKCPCPSALCMSFNKLPLNIWQLLLKATINTKLNLIAIDGSGMSRPLPSPYFCKRIDKPYPVEIPLKLSIAIDTRKKKILATMFLRALGYDSREKIIELFYKTKKVALRGKKAEELLGRIIVTAPVGSSKEMSKDEFLGRPNQVVNNTLINKYFSWEPDTRLKDGLAKTYAWIYDEIKNTGIQDQYSKIYPCQN